MQGHSIRAAHQGFKVLRSLARTNVAGGREAEAADEAGAEVGDDVAVQVGHDQHVELRGILDQLHARVVHDQLVVLNVRVALVHLRTPAQEHAMVRQVAFLHII